MKCLMPLLCVFCMFAFSSPALADPQQFKVDEAHTSVRFKISHVGFSWLHGRFNDVSGELTYDPEDPSSSSARFTVKTASIDTNHAERDKHLRSEDFLAVDEHPTATFVSTDYEKTGEDTAILTGKLTLNGVTQPIELKVTEMAAKVSPWGKFRRAFSAKGTIVLADFNIDYDLGPAAQKAYVYVSVEAVRQ